MQPSTFRTDVVCELAARGEEMRRQRELKSHFPDVVSFLGSHPEEDLRTSNLA
jgi:hypothetical protein